MLAVLIVCVLAVTVAVLLLLKDGKISEFWVLADIDFDYKA